MGDAGLSFILIQSIGFIGYIIYSYSSYIKTSEKIAIAEAVGCSIIALQTLLLGSLTGAAGNLVYIYVAFIIQFIAPKVNDTQYKGLILSSLVGIYGLAAFNWQGDALQILALTATSLFVLGRAQKNLRIFRGFALASVVFWLTFNVLLGSIPALIFLTYYAYGHVKALFFAELSVFDIAQRASLYLASRFVLQASE
tara:strand:+ start:766 stop:1356 length:591 start_codon:yes stop_codon:yes gene_type:complete